MGENEHSDNDATTPGEYAEDVEEPSTEKEPGEEPKAPEKHDPDPDHQAVGIGVVGRPQTDLEDTGREAP